MDSDLHACRVATLVGAQSFANGLVFDSRVFTPLTSVVPVQAADSGATNMQHMAVVRDFLVPDGGGTPPPSSVLTFGNAVTATVTTGNWTHYTIDVPADSATVTLAMTGSGGDADLYVRKAGQPTASTYDFRPYLTGSNETVSITGSTTPALSSGTWYVSVYGFSTATFTLTPSWTTSTSASQTLLDTTDTVNTGAWKNYTVTVPAGKTRMTVTMTGSSGDADLYIKKTAQPTTSSYDFRPYLEGSNESVIVDASTMPALSSGTWFISVNGYATATFTVKVVAE